MSVIRSRAWVAALLFAVSGVAFGANEWSTLETRAEWRERLMAESNDETTTVFDPVGHLVGMSGHFKLESDEPIEVGRWLMDRGEMLGLLPGENVVFTGAAPFFEAVPLSTEEI